MTKRVTLWEAAALRSAICLISLQLSKSLEFVGSDRGQSAAALLHMPQVEHQVSFSHVPLWSIIIPSDLPLLLGRVCVCFSQRFTPGLHLHLFSFGWISCLSPGSRPEIHCANVIGAFLKNTVTSHLSNHPWIYIDIKYILKKAVSAAILARRLKTAQI